MGETAVMQGSPYGSRCRFANGNRWLGIMAIRNIFLLVLRSKTQWWWYAWYKLIQIYHYFFRECLVCSCACVVCVWLVSQRLIGLTSLWIKIVYKCEIHCQLRSFDIQYANVTSFNNNKKNPYNSKKYEKKTLRADKDTCRIQLPANIRIVWLYVLIFVHFHCMDAWIKCLR